MTIPRPFRWYSHSNQISVSALAKRARHREIIIVRGQFYVSRLPKYWPPTPSLPRRVCPPPPTKAGGTQSPGGEGGQLFGRRETQDCPLKEIISLRGHDSLPLCLTQQGGSRTKTPMVMPTTHLLRGNSPNSVLNSIINISGLNNHLLPLSH